MWSPLEESQRFAGAGEQRGGAVRYLEGEGVNVVVDLYNVGDTAEHSAYWGGLRRAGVMRDATAW
jgi:hypothetical protein